MTRHLALSGFMATGKSTLGPRVAQALALPFVDTDHEIEVAAGQSLAEIWRAGGEPAFREAEAGVVKAVLRRREPHVIALGGGVVAQAGLRRLARERSCIVTLAASPESLASRIGDASLRPLLSGYELTLRIAQLLEERAEAYAECTECVTTDRVPIHESVEAIVRAHRRDAVLVPLGRRTYTVEVVRDSPERLTAAIESVSPSRVIVVTDASVERARKAALDAALVPLAAPVAHVALPAGEQHKTLASVEVIWSAALGAGADRKSVIVAYGGGVISDLSGFAAATLLRGIAWVACPTSLLAMVDAGVGGKTGFDFASGKNLIGATHQPRRVVCDVGHLASLPPRELVAGLAEVVKIALVADGDLLAHLENVAPRLAKGPDLDLLQPVIRRSIELKARFVADDERDAGRRLLLNVGHTVGHALEAQGGFTGRLHGEALAIGIAVELAAAERLGLVDSQVRESAVSLLESLGLSTRVAPSELSEALSHLHRDKKRDGANIDWPIASRAGEGRVVRMSIDSLCRAVLGKD